MSLLGILFMENFKFNGWFLYWSILIVINFFAFVMSSMAGNIFSCILSGFMLLFCSLALHDNYLRSLEE